jgi:hypothetical protein
MADIDKIIYLRNQYSESTAGNAPPPPLDGGGGGPHDPGMESRVTRLETEFKYVRRDLDEIKVTLEHVGARLNELPTKRDLTTDLQWIIATTFGVCFAVVSIFVGVLAYLQDQKTASSASSPAAPAPIIIQIPSIAPSTVSPPTVTAPHAAEK